jgi:hypothetical protein
VPVCRPCYRDIRHSGSIESPWEMHVITGLSQPYIQSSVLVGKYTEHLDFFAVWAPYIWQVMKSSPRCFHAWGWQTISYSYTKQLTIIVLYVTVIVYTFSVFWKEWIWQ